MMQPPKKSLYFGPSLLSLRNIKFTPFYLQPNSYWKLYIYSLQQNRRICNRNHFGGILRHREKYLSQQIGKLPTKSYLHIWTLQKFVH